MAQLKEIISNFASSPNLGIGVKENTVFPVFHPDAIDLFNTCSDLKKVAWDLADPNYRLHEEVGHGRTSEPFKRIRILIRICNPNSGEGCPSLQAISAHALRKN